MDKPANDYLGRGKLTGLAGDASLATVRRVMSHTAGLPLHAHFFYADQPYEPPPADDTIEHYGILVFAPGSLYEYSNLGYGIIDHIIERVSGEKYPDYMRAHVFQPLGLTHTSVGVAPGLESLVAQRYDVQKNPIPFYVFDHTGASAIYSSAHDLVRFGMFHLKDHLADQRSILRDATLDQAHTAVPPAKYGLGWGVSEELGFLRLSHTGAMPGVATIINLYPSEDLAVVVLSSTGGQVNIVAQELAAAVDPVYADRMRANGGAKPFVDPPLPPSELNKLTGEWAGTLRTWKATLPFRLSVRDSGEVKASIGDQPMGQVFSPAFRGGRLTGQMAAQIPTEDAQRSQHVVLLGLQLVDGVLRGQVSAQTATRLPFFSLASYAELKRQTK